MKSTKMCQKMIHFNEIKAQIRLDESRRLLTAGFFVQNQ